MRAVWLTGHRGPASFEVRETLEPTPGSGQVRIRVRAAGVNFAELMASQGLYPDAPAIPCILGYEAAGTIDAVGDGVERGQIGQRVMALTRFGAHAEVVCVERALAVPMPGPMSFEEAVAIPVNYLTAYHMLFHVGNLRQGESVLVHMAAGGVGTAALQLCRSVDGVVTFGTASSSKHEAIRANGCTYPIDYRMTDYVAEVRRLTGGDGIDIALDALGGENFRKDYSLLKPAGRLICFGFANLVTGRGRNLFRVLGQIWSMPKFNPLRMMRQNRTVAGVNMLHMYGARELLAGEMRAVLDLYDRGVVKPIVDSIVPFAQAAAAFTRLLEGKNIGKVVLAP